MSTEELLDLRITILNELNNALVGSKTVDEVRLKVAERLLNAQADKIALEDPAAGERYRRIIPEF